MFLRKFIIPKNYDYVGVYLTDKCHLSCPYCITQHHRSSFGKHRIEYLKPEEWVTGLNRLELPKDVPITLQGGEPFLYKGIWKILERVHHKIDILTAFPKFLNKEHFIKLDTLRWNRRIAPYPTIRVSYHKGQNNFKKLIERIADLQDILSIGLYYLDHPDAVDEIEKVKEYAKKYKVELRKKEFLGKWNNKMYGDILYKDAAKGERLGVKVLCKNTVVPIAPDGSIYRCHSDMYFNRRELTLGTILDRETSFPKYHLGCMNYGLCSECDVKVKTNHYQQYGYTSVDIKFMGVLAAK